VPGGRAPNSAPLCTGCGRSKTLRGLCSGCRTKPANKPARLCQRCKVVPLEKGRQGLRFCPDCTKTSCGHAPKASGGEHLSAEQALEEIERLTSLGAGATFELVAIATGRTRQLIQLAEARAMERFREHYRALVTLPEQAGIWVDWDWVLGLRDTERASENDAGPVE
jgi:hypothetical protein